MVSFLSELSGVLRVIYVTDMYALLQPFESRMLFVLVAHIALCLPMGDCVLFKTVNFLHTGKTRGLPRGKRAPAEGAGQENLQIKRTMLELMHEDQRMYKENIEMVNNNITTIARTIKDGFDLLRTLIQQQNPVSAPPQTPIPAPQPYGLDGEAVDRHHDPLCTHHSSQQTPALQTYHYMRPPLLPTDIYIDGQ